MNSSFGISIDSTPFQSAVIDSSGTIVAVNEAWRVFAERNGASASVRMGVGLNYLAICHRAHGSDSDESSLAELSLRRVLSGDQFSVSFQYPCHSPCEQRWFLFSARPFRDECCRALVTHVYVGEEPAPRKRLGLNGHQPDGIIVGDGVLGADTYWRRDMLLFHHVQEMTSAGGWEWSLQDGQLHWTPETFRIHDLSPVEFTPTLESMLAFYGKHDRRRLQSAILRAEHSGAPFELALSLTSAARRRVNVRVTGRADIQRLKPLRLYGMVQDTTGLHVHERRLASVERANNAS